MQLDHNRSLKAMLVRIWTHMAVKAKSNDFVSLNSRLSAQFEAILIREQFLFLL